MICMLPTRKYPNGRFGTDAGYQAHWGAGEIACPLCREANNKAQRAKNPEQRRATRRRYEAKVGATELKKTHKAFRDRRVALVAEAKAKPCADCGVEYPYYVMQFDHRDPSTKLFSIGTAKMGSWERIEAEIAKCDVVCANCHMERTHGHRKQTE